MSKIDELIEELCPEGVPTRLVADLFAYEQPTKYLVSSTDYVDSGIPVLTAGQTFLLGHTIETDGIYPASPEAPVIIFDDFTTGFQWVDFPFKAKSSAMKMITPRSLRRDELRFLYHWMGVRNFRPGEHARHWISVYSQFEIPSPPLDAQREIVSILDKFTQLEAELEAELEARRIQYEVTRDRLLDFSGDLGKHPLLGKFTMRVLSNTPTHQLGDIVEYSRDRVPASTLGAETFVGVDNLRANKMGLSDSDYVPTAGQLTKFGFGSVLLGNIRPYLRKIWLSDREGGCSGDVLCFNRKAEGAEHVAAAYLYHCLASEDFFRFNVQHSKGAKMPRGDKKALMGYSIFLPPIEVQNEIVSILDKLDALVNDITIGLPAEIAARRKQYEYYRNKLLTFKELEAA